MDFKTRCLIRRATSVPKEVSIQLRDNHLLIGLRGFQGFDPKAYHSVATKVHIRTDRGVRVLAGRLHIVLGANKGIPQIDLRGSWFKYVFEPEPHDAAAVHLVLERDDHMWSNVECIDLETDAGPLRLTNEFFCAPPAAAS